MTAQMGSEYATDYEFYAEIMAEADREIQAEIDEENRKQNRILRAIEAVKGKPFADEVRSCIYEEAHCTGLSLVRKPVGSYDFEGEYENIPGYWVDQWQNGGWTGDDFAGDIYIQLKEGLYLKAGYAC